MIPKAPDPIPAEILFLIKELGKNWRNINHKNCFKLKTIRHWNKLILEWADDLTMPLLIRNSRVVRGGVLIHSTSERELIFCDNSPAKWVAEQVFQKSTPTLKEIKALIKKDQIPYKFAPVKGEQENAKYKCISKNDLNKQGWKLCHINSVGLKNQKNVTEIDLLVLKAKFINLMSPDNFFILPKSIGGLGEIKEFIDLQK